MAVIFLFSTSIFGFVQTFSVIEPLLRYFFPDISRHTVEAVNYVVRKAAHMAAYAAFALLWYRAFAGGKAMRPDRAAMLSLAIVVLSAASDELHQHFVMGRTASVIDVVWDSVGAALGLVILLVWKRERPARMPT